MSSSTVFCRSNYFETWQSVFIFHSSLSLTAAKPGTHSIIIQIVLLTGFIFYISLRCLQRFPEPFSGKFRNNCSVNRNFPEHFSVTFHSSRTTSRKFPVYEKNRSGYRSGIPDFRNLFHNGNRKNVRIISLRKRNPQFRWKSYI